MFAKQLPVSQFVQKIENEPNAKVEVVRQQSACVVVEGGRQTTKPALVVVCEIAANDGMFVANETILLGSDRDWEAASNQSKLWQAVQSRLMSLASSSVTQVHRSGSL